jgi:acyl transferase domain-containing protein/NADP-dependent 3-hydroxy acid dehydrogenase YdfG/thioesterase domain-containing protein/acyl carrier protein
MNKKKYSGMEIAVIGMSCKFPGADTYNDFWHNLVTGKESIIFLNDDDIEDRSLLNDSSFVKTQGGSIEGKDYFDAGFFNYTEDEAELIDPQSRLFHECVWQALEDAACNPLNYKRKIGLYAGFMANPIWESLSMFSVSKKKIGDYAAKLLVDKDFAPLNLAYKLNLKGPAYLVQSSCSTSLVAVHLATRSLLTGECNIAIAGGAAVSPMSQKGYIYQEGMILSPDGHCRAFDAKAKGTIFGEGVGIVVLKRIEDAIRDKDNIHAVILGSASNNDGNRKVNFSAPSIEGQADCIKEAIRISNVEPATITYIETHGTGTELGDPIEIEALKLAYVTPQKKYCALGSVKTNIGHLDAAAGIAGFIKTVLMLKNKQIPPSLYFYVPNPKIDFENSPFYVNNVLKNYEALNDQRRAAVSSFGMGGTNVHVILEEFAKEEVKSNSDYTLLVFSGKTKNALLHNCKKHLDYLLSEKIYSLSDVAYTLQFGRAEFQYRKSFVVKSREDIAYINVDDISNVDKVEPAPTIIFMFPGQEAQYQGMACELYRNNIMFKKNLDKCFSYIKEFGGIDLFGLFHNKTPDKNIDITLYTQPLLFSIQYSLAQFMILAGIRPAGLIGHSIGEYVAACISGVFSLEDALQIVVYRSQLMNNLPKCSMLSIHFPVEKIKEILPEDLSIAAINSPNHCVVSGKEPDIMVFSQFLKSQNIGIIKLNTSHAFHSYIVEPVMNDYLAFLKRFCFNEPAIPFVTNLNGEWCGKETFIDANYFVNQLRGTVNFHKGILRLQHDPNLFFIEIGPERSLTGFLQEYTHFNSYVCAGLLPHAKLKVNDYLHLVKIIGKILERGLDINWEILFDHKSSRKIPLPTYAFERNQYWPSKESIAQLALIEKNINNQDSLSKQPSGELKQENEINSWYYSPYWEQYVSLRNNKDNSVVDNVMWIIVTDNTVGASLYYKLEKQYRSVYIFNIKKRERYKDQYPFLDLEDMEDIEEKISGIIQQTEKDIKIIYFTPNLDSGANLCLAQQEKTITNIYALLNFVRVIGNISTLRKIEIRIITNGIHDVNGTEAINPFDACMLGLIKVASQEYRNISFYNIDIKLDEFISDENKEKLIGLIKPTEVITAAIRGRYLWKQAFKKIKDENISSYSYKTNGVYIITGGFGGMASCIAKYILLNTEANVILIGRTPINEIESSSKESNKQKQEIKNELNRISKKYDYYSIDVSDYEDLRKVIDQIIKQYGNIDGIFHTAGLADYGGIIERRDNESVLEVIKPKIAGTINLYSLCKDKLSDFLLLFSSIGNILYEQKFGQVAYNIGNEFLDAFSAVSDKIYTINWTDWKKYGMTVAALKRDKNADEMEEILDEMEALTPEEGMSAINYVLSKTPCRVAVSKKNIFIELLEKKEKLFYSNKIAKKERINRPDISAKFKFPETGTQKALCNIFQDYFKFNKIGIDDDFFELGADSLKIINIQSYIRNSQNINIDLNDFYECPNIRQLAAKIDNKIINEFYKKVNQVFIKIGNGQKKIFAFPPAVGIGYLAYSELSKYLSNYSVFAFNFIIDINRIETYSSIIADIAKAEDVVFIGYSAGGALAFEVAKNMQKKYGLIVDKIIVLDTYIYRKRYARDKDSRKILTEFFEKVKTNYGETVLQRISSQMARYYFYVNNLVLKGSISANIYLIKATDREEEEEENFKFLKKFEKEHEYIEWNELTQNKYWEYNGFGSHAEMLSDINLTENVKIIKEILKRKY